MLSSEVEAPVSLEQRVLILAPFGRDSSLIVNILKQAGIPGEACDGMDSLCTEITRGAGAVLVADESLSTQGRKSLEQVIERQPPWSDLPIVVMTLAGDTGGRDRLLHLQPLGNLTMLERPLRAETIISSFRMALRARSHQYQLRSYLETEQRDAALLRESEARYRTLTEALPQLVWTCLPTGECDYLSRQWLDYTGLPAERQLGTKWSVVIHPDDRRRTELCWARATRGEADYDLEYRIRRHDGLFRWFKTRGVPLRDAEGHTIRWFGTCTDIEDQKQLLIEREDLLKRESEAHATLQRSNLDLRRANEDLNQFAFSASHDLQEPLRMVVVYSQMLQRKYKDGLDAQALEYIGYTVQGARRMELLLKDLLDYTQVVDGVEELAEPVDAGHLVARSIENLSQTIKESAASIKIGDLPFLKVKEVHLLQLFQNLIGNALKYRSESNPCIEIAAQPDGKMWRLNVSDNGIGIDKQYATQIFGLFKRLHGGGSRYEGTGIGLAICQKIVERYGGRIWVESDGQGSGSTFWFTLPGAEQTSAGGLNPRTAG